MRVINSISIFFLLLSAQISLVVAQTNRREDIKIGDKIPDQIMSIISKYEGGEKKTTIINFWATWCVPCIKELKLLDTILKETDGINILSVTYEDNKKVQSFLDRNPELKSGKLTFVPSDTLFHIFFPHRILPHNVWINDEGVVKNITGGDDMTRENILSFIKEKSIVANNKEDKIKFDPFEPFHLSDSEFIYRSILTKRINGIFSGKTVHTVGHADRQKIVRVFCYNSTLFTMLWLAINKNKSPNNYYNTMRIETKDSLRFFAPPSAPLTFSKSKYKTRDEWREGNTHCYELSFPKPINDTLFYSYMLDDLKRNLNIQIKVIEDSILCSIISFDKKVPNVNESDSTFLNLNKTGLTARNVSVLSLFEFLNEKVKKSPNDKPIDPPFVDRTGGMRIDVDLEFENISPDYEYIKDLISKKYGLKIRYQKERYKITVIKDMS